jgi:hypothetical protein
MDETMLEDTEQSTKKSFIPIAVVIIVIILIGAVIAFFVITGKNATTSTQQLNITGTPTTIEKTPIPTGTPATSNSTFENNQLKITIKKGWGTYLLENGAINVTKDGYILYINPSYIQSSTTEGGRFDEITMNSPSAQLIIPYRPSAECGIRKQTKVLLNKYSRYDYFVDKTVNKNICNTVSDDSTRWYFSFYVVKDPYVNYYKIGEPSSYVITLSAQVASISELPKQEDAVYLQIQNEVQDMIGSLLIK